MSYNRELILHLFETLLTSPTELKEKLDVLKKLQEDEWIRDVYQTEETIRKIEKVLVRGTDSRSFDMLKSEQETLQKKVKFLQDRISGVSIWESIVNSKG